VIERHAMRHTRATIVTHHGEAIESERAHDLDLVLSHRPFRIAAMIVSALRLV